MQTVGKNLLGQRFLTGSNSGAVFLFSFAVAKENNPSVAPSHWRGAKEGILLLKSRAEIYIPKGRKFYSFLEKESREKNITN